MGDLIDFQTANRIYFRTGAFEESVPWIAALGNKVLVFKGARAVNTSSFVERLDQSGCSIEVIEVNREPSLEFIVEGVNACRAGGFNVILSIGGGSTIDTGKAVAALAANPGNPMDYLEVVGQGKPIGVTPLPFVAVPTTAGTGAEVTRNAVINVSGKGVKVSLRSPLMLPRLAIIDPGLCLTLTPEVTASTGMDAFTQVIEPFVSLRSNWFTDLFCIEGIQLAAKNLLVVFQNGDNLAGREAMSKVSLLGGLALANAGLGAVHGFAGPIGGMYGAPHGAICASLLARVCQANIRALQEREPNNPALRKYAQISTIVIPGETKNVSLIVDFLTELSQQLKIPRLREYGVSRSDFKTIIQSANQSSSMKGNPIRLTDQELGQILEESF